MFHTIPLILLLTMLAALTWAQVYRCNIIRILQNNDRQESTFETRDLLEPCT